MAVCPFPGLPSLLSANLEVRRRLQELQPNDAAETEAGGVTPPAHRGVHLWPCAAWALGFTVVAADPSCREGVGGGLVPQGVPELVDSMVLTQALRRQGAGGGTGLLVVKEAVKGGLLGAGVEGWVCWSGGIVVL